MNQDRLSRLQSMGFVYDASGAKWEERFCLFKNLMKKYGSFDKIPCPNKLKREDFTLEELNDLSRVRKWIWVSCSGQVIPVDACENESKIWPPCFSDSSHNNPPLTSMLSF